MARIEDVLQKLDDLQAKLNILRDAVISANQISIQDGLSDIDANLGLITMGEFRSGNGKLPGQGFTGGRYGYPGFLYNGVYWFLAGVNDDKLMVGLELSSGKILAAEGNLIIDDSGLNLNGIRYALRHYAEDIDGNNPRYGRFEMFYPDGETIPALGITFLDATVSTELVNNGGFETGDFTGWTAGGSHSVQSGSAYEGTYCAKLVNSGITSDRISVTGGQRYHVRYAGKKGTGNVSCQVKWYDAPSGGTLVRTDSLTGVSSTSWELKEAYLNSPGGALSAEIAIGVVALSNGYCDAVSMQAIAIQNRLYFAPDLYYQDSDGIRRVLSSKMELPSPRSAIVATLVTTSTGNVTNGAHTYKITCVDAFGESLGSPASNSVTVDATHKQVTLTLPIGPTGTVSRNIYRTTAGGSVYYLLANVANNTSTIYTDNIADGSLGATSEPLVNTTGSFPLLPTRALVRWQVDAFSRHRTGDTWVASNATTGSPYGFACYGSNSANAENGDLFEFDVYLAPGTYKMYLHGLTSAASGKIDVYENDYSTPIASGIDLYSSTITASEKISTVTLQDSGLHHITVKVNGKNASATDYVVYIADIEFVRQ